ncbi:MAG: universal stress protein [Firmicutes bacterium]|nr:universal stress protein [Bacillota bacterium]
MAKKALKVGLELTKSFAAECHALRVTGRPGKVPHREMFGSEISRELTFTDKDFLGAKFTASQGGIEIKTHTFCGNTHEVLKEIFKMEQFDLVIVTPKEKRKIKEALFGSYIDYLLRTTKASVLVVK